MPINFSKISVTNQNIQNSEKSIFWMKLFNFQSRLDYVTAMKRIRLEDPSISLPELEALALEEVFNKAPKSRAYYRY
jgi:hypothetical protein